MSEQRADRRREHPPARGGEARIRHTSLGFFVRKPLFFARAAVKYAAKYLTGGDVLRGIVFASSYRCNFRCSHCYAEPFTRSGDRPLTGEEKLAVIGECLDAGVLAFDFVGGEIGLSEEFPLLLPHCKPRRTHISLASNGYALTRDTVRELKAAGVDKISISVDAGTAEEHDAFRNAAGSYRRCFEAIEFIREAGLTPVIITCVSRGGTRRESFARLIDYAVRTRTELVFSAAVPFGRWAGRSDILCDEEDVAFMRRMHQAHPFLTRDCYENMGSFGCPAAKQILYISEYGDVMPCPFLHVSFGNVRDMSIRQIRERMLLIPELRSYPLRCLAGEDREFIAKRLAALAGSGQYPPRAEEVFPEVHGLRRTEPPAIALRTTARPCPLCGSEQRAYVTAGREHEFTTTTDALFPVVRCLACGLVYLNPRPADSELAAIYPHNYYCHTAAADGGEASALHGVKEFFNARIGFPKRIKALLRSLPGGGAAPLSILDIGCGNGTALDAFKKYAGRPVATTGLDFNARALEVVAAKGHATILGTLETVPLPAGAFAVVYSSNVVEHVGDPLLMLRRAADALMPDGMFLCETPNIDSFDARRFGPSGHWGGFHFPRHWTFFTAETFAAMAERAGLEVVHVDYHPVPIFWIWTMHSLLYRGWGSRERADAFFPLIEDAGNFKKSLFNKVLFTGVDLLARMITGKTSLMSVVMKKRSCAGERCRR